jgi:cell division transport system permease protein
LIGRLQQLYGQVTYVNKEQAWNEFSEQVGDPALLEAVGGNPLPASLRVKLRPELLTYARMDEASRQVSEFPEVEDVRYGGDWVKRIDEMGNAVRRGALVAGVLVGLAIVFVMYNTLRLSVLARRHQVEIMSRLGATDGFISLPFVIEAMIEGVLASALALGLVFALQRAFAAQVVAVSFLPLSWIGAFLAASIALSCLAAMLALSRVLRAVGP